MLILQTRDLRPSSAAVSLPTPINSAAGGLGQIVSKLLILLYSWVVERPFSGSKRVFSLTAGTCDGVRVGRIAPRVYCAVDPPSITRPEPVIKPVSSEAAKPYNPSKLRPDNMLC